MKSNYTRNCLNNINNITKLNAIVLLTVRCSAAVFRTAMEKNRRKSNYALYDTEREGEREM